MWKLHATLPVVLSPVTHSLESAALVPGSVRLSDPPGPLVEMSPVMSLS